MSSRGSGKAGLVRAGAVASVVAGVVHLEAARSHIGGSIVELLFFASVASFQLTWTVFALRRPGKAVWRAGAVVNATVAAIWLLSRTTGLPFGPHSGHVASVGTADLLATIVEVVILATAALHVSILRSGRLSSRRPAFALLAALITIVPLPSAAHSSSNTTPAQHRANSRASGGVKMPLASNMTFGFAKGRLVAFTYVQQYFCTVDATDDLDGLGHEGDGKIAAMDPDEMAAPPCIIGKTGRGSLPLVDPTGRDARLAPRLYGIIPAFDADGDLVEETDDPTPGIQTACPQPGPPYTSVKGTPRTCTMHPLVAHAEPYLPTLVRNKSGVTYPGDLPAGELTVGGHSHVVEYTASPVRWWVATVVFVHDASIWPDFTGKCPAGRGCLTSVAAIRAAQRAGKAEPDVPTNVWFDFSVRTVHA